MHSFYTYDNRDTYRDSGVQFLVSKELIREFSYEKLPSYPQVGISDICLGCANIESRIKDICFWCDNDFNNNVENYKLNGNTCEDCVIRFQYNND